jgi:hypothetical protein
MQMLVPFVQRDATPLTGTYIVGDSVFVAFVNDTANSRSRFFWGRTPATVVEVATSDFAGSFADVTTFTNPAFAGTTVHLGACGREGAIAPQDHFGGILDSWGLVFDQAMTLAELQEVAYCGRNAPIPYHWPIDGTDPEPGIVTINGTTVVDGICIPFVAPAVSGAQLITCM